MKKDMFTAGVVIAAVLTLGVPAHAFKGEKYAKEARIGITKARKAALKAFHGRITSEELEKERGGSGLRYSFDIPPGPGHPRGRCGRPDGQDTRKFG